MVNSNHSSYPACLMKRRDIIELRALKRGARVVLEFPLLHCRRRHEEEQRNNPPRSLNVPVSRTVFRKLRLAWDYDLRAF